MADDKRPQQPGSSQRTGQTQHDGGLPEVCSLAHFREAPTL